MNPIEQYFDKIFVIHQPHRKDRMAHMQSEWKRHGFTKMEVFEAHSGVKDHSGKINGNSGCVASHRALMEIIAYHRFDKVAIFEDDFEFVGDEAMEQFSAMIPEVPATWQFLYLGGHYAEPPVRRVSEAVVQCAGMLTTSSYAVRWKTAREIAPYLCGCGPIDSLISGFLAARESYIFDPRICVQYASFSDLTERESANAACMMDDRHARMV